MVIDSSALVAIFMNEPDRGSLLTKIREADTRRLSATNLFETGMVLEARRGEAAGREFDLFVLRMGLQIVSVDAEQVELARQAWRKYGKGRHPASLNFGDCFAYALAKLYDEPLLAKGSDFRQTDLDLCE